MSNSQKTPKKSRPFIFVEKRKCKNKLSAAV
jgi:hypothetical protein